MTDGRLEMTDAEKARTLRLAGYRQDASGTWIKPALPATPRGRVPEPRVVGTLEEAWAEYGRG